MEVQYSSPKRKFKGGSVGGEGKRRRITGKIRKRGKEGENKGKEAKGGTGRKGEEKGEKRRKREKKWEEREI
jgi:hypothetical protein